MTHSNESTPRRVDDPITLGEMVLGAVIFAVVVAIVFGSIGAVIARWFGWL